MSCSNSCSVSCSKSCSVSCSVSCSAVCDRRLVPRVATRVAHLALGVAVPLRPWELPAPIERGVGTMLVASASQVRRCHTCLSSCAKLANPITSFRVPHVRPPQAHCWQWGDRMVVSRIRIRHLLLLCCRPLPTRSHRCPGEKLAFEGGHLEQKWLWQCIESVGPPGQLKPQKSTRPAQKPCVENRCAGSIRDPRPNLNEILRFGPCCTLRFLIDGFGDDRNSLVLGIWATPAAPKTFPKCEGLRPHISERLLELPGPPKPQTKT